MHQEYSKKIVISDFFNPYNMFEFEGGDTLKSSHIGFKLFIRLMLPIRYLMFLILLAAIGSWLFTCFGFFFLLSDDWGVLQWFIAIIDGLLIASFVFALVADAFIEYKKRLNN